MTVRIQPVDASEPSRLIEYGKRYGPEHDESYLPGVDFELGPEYPACLLMKDGEAVGAVVLMRTAGFRKAAKGRFSILHSVVNSREAYALLLEAVRPHFRGLRSVYLFLPDRRHEVRSILEELGFSVERYSFGLEYRDPATPEVRFPPGYAVRPLDPADRGGIRRFTDCVNENFRELAGHVDSVPADIRRWFDEDEQLAEGICLLEKDGEPAGTLRLTCSREEKDAAEISGLSVLPGHRGAGLGRMLLRYGVSSAHSAGFSKAVLSVNAENETALRLYRSEGFLTVETVVCYSLTCDPRQTTSRSA